MTKVQDICLKGYLIIIFPYKICLNILNKDLELSQLTLGKVHDKPPGQMQSLVGIKNYQCFSIWEKKDQTRTLHFFSVDLELVWMILDQNHDTSSGGEQYLCEISTSSVLPSQKNRQDTTFPVTLNLPEWLKVKIKTHHQEVALAICVWRKLKAGHDCTVRRGGEQTHSRTCRLMGLTDSRMDSRSVIPI